MIIPKSQTYDGPEQVVFNNNKLRKLYSALKAKTKLQSAEIERLKAEVLAGDERECLLTQEILQKGEK